MLRLSFIFFTLFAVVIPPFAQAQDDGLPTPGSSAPQPTVQRNPIIPASPEAASLGQWGNIDVSLYTGQPSISVPIWTLQARGISVPVSLSYNTSGIKVEEIATWVGLGWSLNAGGVITRSVMGGKDEGSRYYLEDDPYDYSSYYKSWPQLKKYLAGYGSADGYQQGEYWDHHYFETEAAAGNFETQPDLINFNFGGYSGKLIINPESGEVTTQPYMPWKVQAPYGPDRPGSAHVTSTGSWRITTEDGTTYTFQIKETTRATDSYSGRTHNHTSAWYLSKIEPADGGDVIRLDYIPRPNVELKGVHSRMESDRWLLDPNEYFAHNELNAFGESVQTRKKALELCGNDLHQVNPVANLQSTFVDQYFLSRIYTEDGRSEVSFQSAANARKDHEDGQRLDKIIIKEHGVEIKAFELDYGYFASHSALEVPSGDHTFDPIHEKEYRLKLKSITEKGIYAAQGDEKPPYFFEYHEQPRLPHRESMAMDYWGYYNGADGNTTLLPAIQNYDGKVHQDYPGANRNSSAAHMQAGTLQKIYFPTGGYTEFQFEPHLVWSGSLPQIVVPDIEKTASTGASGDLASTNPLTYFNDDAVWETMHVSEVDFTIRDKDGSSTSEQQVDVSYQNSWSNMTGISMNGHISAAFVFKKGTRDSNFFQTDFNYRGYFGVGSDQTLIEEQKLFPGEYTLVVVNSVPTTTLSFSVNWSEPARSGHTIALPNQAIGGLRIKEIRSFGLQDTEADLTKRYEYQGANFRQQLSELEALQAETVYEVDNGKLIEVPKYDFGAGLEAYMPSSGILFSNPVMVDNRLYDYTFEHGGEFANTTSGINGNQARGVRWVQKHDYHCEFLDRRATSMAGMGHSQGSPVAYDAVVEYAIDPAAGKTNGYTVYEFENSPAPNNTRFPYPPMSNRTDRNGDLLKKTVYNAAHQKVEETINEYEAESMAELQGAVLGVYQPNVSALCIDQDVDAQGNLLNETPITDYNPNGSIKWAIPEKYDFPGFDAQGNETLFPFGFPEQADWVIDADQVWYGSQQHELEICMKNNDGSRRGLARPILVDDMPEAGETITETTEYLTFRVLMCDSYITITEDIFLPGHSEPFLAKDQQLSVTDCDAECTNPRVYIVRARRLREPQDLAYNCFNGPQPYADTRVERYTFRSYWKTLTRSTQITYDLDDPSKALTVTTDYTYGNPAHTRPTKVKVSTSDQKPLLTYLSYPTDYDPLTLAFIDSLLSRNQVTRPIEEQLWQQEGEQHYLLGAKATTYRVEHDNLVTDKIYLLESETPLAGTPGIDPASAQSRPALMPEVRFFKHYDEAGNIVEVSDRTEVPKTYIWGYGQLLPVAEVSNAAPAEVIYTSFEEATLPAHTQFTLANIAPDRVEDPAAGPVTEGDIIYTAQTGRYSYQLDATGLSITAQTTRRYYLDLYHTGNSLTVQQGAIVLTAKSQRPGVHGWQGYRYEIDASTGDLITVNGEGKLDELRFYPKDAGLVTYTYRPGVGMHTVTDAAGKSLYYHYDGLGRLTHIRDFEGNIIEAYTYAYGERPISMGNIIASPTLAQTANPVTFDASYLLTTRPAIATNATYHWDFGDGSAVVSTQNLQITHTYAQKGSYTVSVEIAPADGDYPFQLIQTLVLEAVDPLTGSITSNESLFDGLSGEQVRVRYFDAIVSGGTGAYAYAWEYDLLTDLTEDWQAVGEGGQRITIPTPDGISYQLRLTVTDLGGAGITELIMTYDWVEPLQAVISGPAIIARGQTASYSLADFTGGIAPYSYQWRVKETNTPLGTGETINYTGECAGQTLELSIIDGHSSTLVIEAPLTIEGNDLLTATINSQQVTTSTDGLYSVSSMSGNCGTVSYTWLKRELNVGETLLGTGTSITIPASCDLTSFTLALQVTDELTTKEVLELVIPSNQSSPITASFNTLSLAMASGQSQTVSVNVSGGCGNNSYTYTWYQQIKTPNDSSWNNLGVGTQSQIITASCYDFRVKVLVEDGVGNSYELISDPIMVSGATAPMVSISRSPSGSYNGPIDVTWSATATGGCGTPANFHYSWSFADGNGDPYLTLTGENVTLTDLNESLTVQLTVTDFDGQQVQASDGVVIVPGSTGGNGDPTNEQ